MDMKIYWISPDALGNSRAVTTLMNSLMPCLSNGNDEKWGRIRNIIIINAIFGMAEISLIGDYLDEWY